MIVDSTDAGLRLVSVFHEAGVRESVYSIVYDTPGWAVKDKLMSAGTARISAG